MTHLVRAEGVERIAVVSDEPEKYASPAAFPSGTTIHHRDALDPVQRELRATPGATVMIYDQTCAAEKRRRRKRGTFPDPAKRVFINELVCEGCGDCSVQSNCLSVIPVETEYGRKRAIDQSSCNKDYSCIDGFCPSFVTIEGGTLRKEERALPALDSLPEIPLPSAASLQKPVGIVVTGVGGTGVITIGALIGMAAHLDGRGVTVLDQTGLAQKGGAVTSHVRIALRPEDLNAVRIDTGAADLVLGADLVVAASPDVISTIENGRTRAIINSHETPTADSTLNRDFDLQADRLKAEVLLAAGEAKTEFIDATAIGTRFFGDSITANIFLLGLAFQRGSIPVSLESLTRAIELNGVSVETSKRVFALGRVAAVSPDLLRTDEDAVEPVVAETLQDEVDRRAAFLSDYQDAAYAERYRQAIALAEDAEQRSMPGETEFATAVASGLFKLMAYKDEYEVARLFTATDFRSALDKQFVGPYRIKYHLAPPLISRPDEATGRPMKSTFGPWVFSAFRVLASLKRLRGTPFDLLGYQKERQAERHLVRDYDDLIKVVAARLSPATRTTAIALAQLPHDVRGYGPVKRDSIEAFYRRRDELLAQLNSPQERLDAAE